MAVEQLTRVLPRIADDEVRAEVAQIHQLLAGLDPYLEVNAGPESPALQDLDAATRATAWTAPLEQEMLSGHVEGKLLQMLVRATRARRVLEIGMFTGYSALAMAMALPDDGRVVACEVDTRAAEIAQRCFATTPAGERIEVRLGPALETLGALGAESACFDLVFIDADKAGYLGYLHTLLDLDLLAPGALVCVDNTLLQGQPWAYGEPSANGASIAAFNRAVAEDPRLDQVLLPLRDGLTLILPTEPA
ncbi:SAM-dependent methyltransferase [Nocardioides mangrovicus]|uniref:SAM-dependent methyltransferase n=1 Tax=Nocardioides mangrovicus TaxID=2478913 RepID=A0A3L8NZG6_9ACTN|nr:SAM-dependent methyltransferase [Nocardioides mangrovicus]